MGSKVQRSLYFFVGECWLVMRVSKEFSQWWLW
jgi:hypothetical protein